MARVRVAATGRFARGKREDSEDVGRAGAGKARARDVGAAPDPQGCRTFVRGRLAEAMPDITAVLVAKARRGSLQHMKLLMQLSGLDKDELAEPSANKTLQQFLMEGLGAGEGRH